MTHLTLVIERPEPGDWHGRMDVLEALEAAGWIGDDDYPLSILRHPSGAVWAVTNESGDSGLTCPNGANPNFPSDTPSLVVIAACLAAVADHGNEENMPLESVEEGFNRWRDRALEAELEIKRLQAESVDRVVVSHAPAVPTGAERMAAVAGILRRTADLVDREDLPQTAGNTADFCDGARWATAEVRRIADAVTTDDPQWRPDGLTELAAELGLTDAERAVLRYALELVDDRIASEGDEFTDEDRAAVESLQRLHGEEVPGDG